MDYVWEAKLECGHTMVIEKCVPGPPGSPVRCFEHDGELVLSEIASATQKRWCPDCNGEGLVTVMDFGPDCGEHQHDCTRCVEGRGLVPVEGS